jgi:hypothetical protein
MNIPTPVTAPRPEHTEQIRKVVQAIAGELPAQVELHRESGAVIVQINIAALSSVDGARRWRSINTEIDTMLYGFGYRILWQGAAPFTEGSAPRFIVVVPWIGAMLRDYIKLGDQVLVGSDEACYAGYLRLPTRAPRFGHVTKLGKRTITIVAGDKARRFSKLTGKEHGGRRYLCQLLAT